MTNYRTYDPEIRREVSDELRSQILAVRLRVVLNERQNRETSPTVMRLPKLELPPIVAAPYRVRNTRADAVVQDSADIRAGHLRTVPANEGRYDHGLEP